jgi:hypothetical protein
MECDVDLPPSIGNSFRPCGHMQLGTCHYGPCRNNSARTVVHAKQSAISGVSGALPTSRPYGKWLADMGMRVNPLVGGLTSDRARSVGMLQMGQISIVSRGQAESVDSDGMTF